ncbi:MAG TPA: hypothetical protein VMB52_01400 [Verrucomicrobiae bacterium]|nr:hypothetical protein [Verrucomicrobiae bacterium]
MSELLTVGTLYEQLSLEYGLDAVGLDPLRSTASIKMIGADGGPVEIGWFEDKGKPGVPLGATNSYALTAVAPLAHSVDHRIVLEQRGLDDPSASLTHEDAFDYLEGYDDYPNILYYRPKVGQPILHETICELADHAMVLDLGQAATFSEAKRRLTLSELRAHGLRLRAQRVGLGFLALS